eukprot:m.155189 g.155189  ORF g.155189 m.155189 type:complete len:52 (+) comp15140_c1_seq17:409-564(+)
MQRRISNGARVKAERSQSIATSTLPVITWINALKVPMTVKIGVANHAGVDP